MKNNILSIILICLLQFSKCSVFSPRINSINYIESDVNISWNKDDFGDNVNVLLLHNEYISQYHNGTEILNKNIINNGYYNWIPEYNLNKYVLYDMDFKILVSSSNDPFSTTIGETITNQYGNNFKLNSNVNITSPIPGTILYSDNILNISCNGFKNNITGTLYYNNGQNILLDEFSFDSSVGLYEYMVPSIVQDYNLYPLYLEINDIHKSITRQVVGLKAAGINILTDSLTDSLNVSVNETFNVSWTNNNFNDINIVEIYDKNNTVIYNNYAYNNKFIYSFNDTNESNFILTIFSHDRTLSSYINITLLQSNNSIVIIPINDTHTDRSLYILFSFIGFIVIVGLLYYCYYGKFSKKNKRQSVHPIPEEIIISRSSPINSNIPQSISSSMVSSMAASPIRDSKGNQCGQSYSNSSRNILTNAMYEESEQYEYPIQIHSSGEDDFVVNTNVVNKNVVNKNVVKTNVVNKNVVNKNVVNKNVVNTNRQNPSVIEDNSLDGRRYKRRSSKSRDEWRRKESINKSKPQIRPFDKDASENYNHITKYLPKNISTDYNSLSLYKPNIYNNITKYQPKKTSSVYGSTSRKNPNNSENRIQLTSPLYSPLNHVGDNRTVKNGLYGEF